MKRTVTSPTTETSLRNVRTRSQYQQKQVLPLERATALAAAKLDYEECCRLLWVRAPTGAVAEEEEENYSDVRCPICFNFFFRAVQTPCHHVFCLHCINRHLEGTQPGRCPSCRGPLLVSDLCSLPHSHPIITLLSKTTAYCPRPPCPWSGSLLAVASHLCTDCGITPVECEHCKDWFVRESLSLHHGECSARPVPCPVCLEVEVLSLHAPVCGGSPMTCGACKSIMAPSRLTKHQEEECPHAMISCPYCEDVKLTREEMKEHETKSASVHTHLLLERLQAQEKQIRSLHAALDLVRKEGKEVRELVMPCFVVIGGSNKDDTVISSAVWGWNKHRGWSSLAPFPFPFLNGSAAKVGSSIYVSGGCVGIAGPSSRHSDRRINNKLWELDFGKSGRWCPLSDLLLPRWAHVSVAVDGVVYMFGGSPLRGPNDEATNNIWATTRAESFDTRSRKREELPPMKCARQSAAVVAIGHQIFVFGGGFWNGREVMDRTNATEIYDTRTKSWRLGKPAPTARGSHGAVYDPVRARVLVLGGSDSKGICCNTVEEYDPTRDEWKACPNLCLPVNISRFVASHDGADTLLVAGGHTANSINPDFFSLTGTSNRWISAPAPFATFASASC